MNGTKQEFNPETIVPLTVFYGDTPIRAFGLQTWIRLTYTQDVESISGTVDMKLYFDDTLKTQVSNHPITQAPPTSGEWTKVTGAVISYTSQKIEEWDASQFKTHTLKCISDIELTVNFEDNTSSDLSGSAYGSMDLRVVQSATLEMEVRGISVALSTSPLL